MSGILYIVATPIGTLGDMSPRAIEVLKSVDFLVCEDTRHSGILCKHFGISTPLVSLHAHNENGRAPPLAQKVVGASAALITDAGTPAICDPGALFVHHCHLLGVRVTSVPGPSALASALAASGFRQPRVLFSGFWPREPKTQRLEVNLWEQARPCVAVCFESPQRILKTLDFFSLTFGDSHTFCLSREISKRFEQHLRGSPAAIKTALESQGVPRGECVLSVDLPQVATNSPTPQDILDLMASWVQEEPGTPLKVLAERAAKKLGLKSKEVYNLWITQKKN